jgi:ribosomal protein S9
VTYRQAAIDADRAVMQGLAKGLTPDHPLLLRLIEHADRLMNDYRRHGDKEKS